MIKPSEITEIGTFLKPHGIKGEIAAEIDLDAEEVTALSCIICEIDGIFVPFFIDSVRSKGRDTVLLTIDGVTDEKQAAAFTGKNIYAKADEVASDDDEDGLYVTDMEGFTILTAEGDEVGIIDRIDDTTANILFIVSTPSGDTVYIPAAEEFIQALDPDKKTIVMDLPEGLI
ncbi:MAG: ribosome maturation factor RimM [Paramuribaculum sp.]|nr:ribosome maturation factor RimM [Paramuribaculum sp.]MDE7452572.1 ribosome maturation factor RimM [Paramuribaculum sp.]